ncbi:hypothetical protein ACU639_36875 [Streptomyces cynarae]|uniref:hypothetical protein n=1 Tax=Streptomyces cynarae TaxID=2981134 RepID=UPI00406C1B61
MTDERDASTELIARRMRTALAEAVWDPAGEPATAVEVLTSMVEAVCGPVDIDEGLIVFESQALSQAYLFCASLTKSLSLDYHRKHPKLRDISPAEHLALIQPHFSQFHQRQQKVLKLIDAEFPSQA